MPPFIEISGLEKRYGDHKVIDGLDLSIKSGEVVIFQGPSGIGKSTLLRSLVYLEPFQQGRIQVGNVVTAPGMDESRDHLKLLALRQQLPYVFQFFNLFPHLTVLDNLTLGPVQVLNRPIEEVHLEALKLLERVGLSNKALQFPGALSGGQQQRVAIARALAMKPKGILFDEPTSSLDPAMKAEVIDVIEDFAQEGLTLLIVTHEPNVVERIASRVITLGPGFRIVSDER